MLQNLSLLNEPSGSRFSMASQPSPQRAADHASLDAFQSVTAWEGDSHGRRTLFGPGSRLAAVVTVAPQPPLADVQRYVAVS